MESIRIHRWNEVIQCKTVFYTPMMQWLLANLDTVLAASQRVLKNDKTSKVIIIKIDEHELVVKRSNTKGWLHFLRRLFLQTRASNNWSFAHELLRRGIKTCEPVAFVEERYGPFRGRSYFISLYIEGMDVLNYFSNQKSHSDCLDAVRSIATLFQRLADLWLSHRDVNLSNIILKGNQPWLIDLDSMRRHRWRFWAKRAAKREQQRFIENCHEMPQMPSDIISLFQLDFNKLDLTKNE